MKNTTEKQKEASRLNGALSRGPVTEAGKQRSARNSFRHGLFSRTIVLDIECKDTFTLLTREYLQSCHPKDAIEESVVEELAVAYWHMRRLWAMETRLLNEHMQKTMSPDLGLTPVPAGADGGAADPYDEEMSRLNTAFDILAGTPKFNLLLRQQGREQRSFHRALGSALKLRKSK